MFKLFKKKQAPNTIEVVKINGYTFRVLDPVKMSNSRRVRFFWEDYAREWGMTKEDILSYIQFIMKETSFPNHAGNLSELNAELADKLKHCYALLSTLDSVIREDFQYKPFLKAACLIILVDDEDEKTIDPNYQKLKLQLCKNDQEIEGFFLTTIRTFQTNIENSQDMSKVSDWYPSENLKVMENSIYKRINTTIYKIGE